MKPTAKAVQYKDINTEDKDGNPIELSLFHVTEGAGIGGVFAIDFSFIDQAAKREDEEKDDGNLIVPNPFSNVENPENILLQYDQPVETIVIQLTQEETEFAQAFLSRKTEDPKESDVPLKKTAEFQTHPGLEADIKCCNGDGPYTDPVLFLNGHEEGILPPGDTLEGTYNFDFDNKIFRVVIKAYQEAEIPVPA